MTLADNDAWAWVEADYGIVRPILGHVFGRTQFPPSPGHPGVWFQRYDPSVPEFRNGAGEFSEVFRDYNAWAGWNSDKSMSVLAMTVDSSADGPPYGHTPRMVRIDTTDEDLSNWSPDESLIYDPSAFTNIHKMRFIPRTNDVSFMATVGSQFNLIRLNTTTMTVDTIYTNLLNYAWSYDGSLIAIDRPVGGVRVYQQDGAGNIGAEVSTGDVFGFTVSDMGFTDNSRYLFAWDGNHHVVHDGMAPFDLQWTYDPPMGFGLFGPEPYDIEQVTAHPQHLYHVRALSISLGLGGSNTLTDVIDWDGAILVPSIGGSEDSPLFGDWSQSGDCWIGVDGGRDPYGGVAKIVQTGTWLVGGDSRQEAVDLRIRPYH